MGTGKKILLGCLVTTVVVVSIAIGVGIALYRKVKREYNTFLPTAPIEIPIATGGQPAAQLVLNEIAEAAGRYQKGGAAQVQLTVQEINALLGATGAGELRGKVYVRRVDKGQIVMDSSFPLDEVGLPGRFLAGQVTVAVGLKQGKPQLQIVDYTADGKSPPGMLLDKLKEFNLIDYIRASSGAAANAAWGEFAKRVDKIEAKNGKLIIEFGQPAAQP